MSKDDLKAWIIEALRDLGGAGSVVDVSRHIWDHHEPELRAAGDLFYTWQYAIRWAAQQLRDEGVLQAVQGRRSHPWRLA